MSLGSSLTVSSKRSGAGAARGVARHPVAGDVAALLRRGVHVLAPFAEVGAGIGGVGLLQGPRQREVGGGDPIVAWELGAALAGRRHAVLNAPPRGRAERSRRVAAGEAHAFARQAIHGGRVEIRNGRIGHAGMHGLRSIVQPWSSVRMKMIFGGSRIFCRICRTGSKICANASDRNDRQGGQRSKAVEQMAAVEAAKKAYASSEVRHGSRVPAGKREIVWHLSENTVARRDPARP